ncbi:MAG: molybdenum cofactor guanylyltransferase [Azoarcus sp.]|jgi:molybdopterin-guanine dinucleotide biosynthesis protein A|nr:molybdenum cofactor guanylyltransferase [Azoarcus sp.]
MIDDCTALILAGGDSRRMGRDKTALPLGGQSLLQRTLALMRTLFPAVLVSVRQPRADIDAPQVRDEIPSAGPLAGLCAGLREAGTPWVFAVAADMPYLRPEVIAYLAAQRGGHQAVVPVVAGHPQSLSAFYAASALPALQATLTGAGRHALRTTLAALDVDYVDERRLRELDPTLQSFTDLDTPQDLAAARRDFENRDDD